MSEALEDTQGETYGSGLFDSFRHTPFPTIYPSLKSAVTADVLEAGLFYAFGILATSFLLILPGVILRKRLLFFIKVVIGLFILTSIFLCNFGQEWEVAEVRAHTQYKAGTKKMIDADVNVKIGLRSVNITLRAHDKDKTTVDFGKYQEVINYNERFSWDNMGWTLGRGGFGPFAGRFNQEFRAAQLKGLPYPILWIAEYFVPDGEGIRWGRFYLQAGYYTHIFLWLAFPLFIMSTLLIMMVRTYGALFFMMTGASMIAGNMCFGLIRNPTQLTIPFEPHALVFRWGWCFWLCIFTGIVNIALGLTTLVLDFGYHDWLVDFLNIDVTQDYEQFYLSREELENLGIIVPRESKPDSSHGTGTSEPGQAEYHGFRKKVTGLEQRLGTTRFGKERATNRYKVISLATNDDQYDDAISEAIFKNPGKERPPLPQPFNNRQPVVPVEQGGACNNHALEFNYDTLGPKDMDTSHGMNVDPRKPSMRNYDNIIPKDDSKLHFRSARAPDPPQREAPSRAARLAPPGVLRRKHVAKATIELTTISNNNNNNIKDHHHQHDKDLQAPPTKRCRRPVKIPSFLIHEQKPKPKPKLKEKRKTFHLKDLKPGHVKQMADEANRHRGRHS